jgi:hypothetical protein
VVRRKSCHRLMGGHDRDVVFDRTTTEDHTNFEARHALECSGRPSGLSPRNSALVLVGQVVLEQNDVTRAEQCLQVFGRLAK